MNTGTSDEPEAFNLAKAEGMDAAIAKFPTVAARRATLESALNDPHFHTEIRGNAAKLRASRGLRNPRRLVASDPLEPE